MSSQIAKQTDLHTDSLKLSVVYTGTKQSSFILNELPAAYLVNRLSSQQELYEYLNDQSILTLPDIILLEADPDGECFALIEKIKARPLLRDIIIILLAAKGKREWKMRALHLKVHDYYVLPFPIDHLLQRLNFLVKFRLVRPQLSILEEADITYRLPLGKRIFDLLISAAVLVIVSPILLLTAIIVKLDSKGPIIYKSKRVGTGYNIFDFYKFRSMHKGAETQLDQFSALNQYNSTNLGPGEQAAFIKLKHDPRVTRFGQFIRSTSIDELPQLFNVLKGDMSLVGNRPIPLYEAEMLTSNEWSLRFMGPAGVTGLWQIKSRGKRDISDRERKKFDNFYASKYSFWFDVDILLKTLPVILHKEKFKL